MRSARTRCRKSSARTCLTRAELATDLLRKALRPRAEPALDPTIGPTPLAAADLFRLATAHPTFSPERLAATKNEAWDWTESTNSARWCAASMRRRRPRSRKARTTGRSRPRARQAAGRSWPTIRTAFCAIRRCATSTHLTAPGFDVIGADEPFLPGISIGHNGRIAFGLTIFYIDQEDVYVYETTPDGRTLQIRRRS